MARYRVTFDRRVRKKDLARLPKADARRIVAVLDDLAENPRRPGVEKLTARAGCRVRGGSYRILYEIDDHEREVTVRKAAHRGDAYRR